MPSTKPAITTVDLQRLGCKCQLILLNEIQCQVVTTKLLILKSRDHVIKSKYKSLMVNIG